MKTKKKGVLVLSGVLLAVIWWWLIYGQSSGQPSDDTLDVWVTWGETPAALQALFDTYTSMSGQPVRVRTRLRSDKVLRAMRGSRSPDLVVLSSSDPVGAFYEQGVVEPLAPWIETAGVDLQDIASAPLARCEMSDGTYVCLPWGCDVDALFWNKDLFEGAGLDPERPPQTMEEVREMAEALTLRDESGQLTQVGFIPGYPRSHSDLYTRMMGREAGDGGEVPTDAPSVATGLDWEQQFESQVSVEEIKAFGSTFTPYLSSRHAVFADRRLSCQQCHRSMPARDDKLPDFGFYTGRVAMMVDGQWQVGAGGSPRFQPDLNYGVVPFPPPADQPERAGTTVVRGPVVLMPSAAADKPGAAELLAWMLSPEVQVGLVTRYGILPASQEAAQSAHLAQDPSLMPFLDLLARSDAVQEPAMPSNSPGTE